MGMPRSVDNPLAALHGPLFHGTQRWFDRFSLDFCGHTDDGYYGVGIYFSPSREAAEEYGGVVKEVRVDVKNPLVLPSSSLMDHESLFDARDILANLLDDPNVGTIRTVPEGYELRPRVQEADAWGPERQVFAVWPKQEMWDAPDVLYGRDMPSPLKAVVSFNDERRDVNYERGWLSGLLKHAMDRGQLTKIAAAKGYDAIVIQSADEDFQIDEVLIWNPDQITVVADHIDGNTIAYKQAEPMVQLPPLVTIDHPATIKAFI